MLYLTIHKTDEVENEQELTLEVGRAWHMQLQQSQRTRVKSALTAPSRTSGENTGHPASH
jgi:hypothetical protein